MGGTIHRLEFSSLERRKCVWVDVGLRGESHSPATLEVL